MTAAPATAAAVTAARRRRWPISRQMLLWQAVVVGAVVLIGFAVFGWLLYRQLSAEYGQRALAVARSVAADPELRAQVAVYSRDDAAGSTAPAAQLAVGPVQSAAEGVRLRTGALFVVVTDDRGIRLAHPNPAQLGLPVSTDPSQALAGREETVQQVGTLGESTRAKVPVFGPPGSATAQAVVGAVSVGISTTEISATLWSDLRVAALFGALALGLGLTASVLLNRRLRRVTLGLEPEELAGLASEHEAVLGGIADGVVGVDARGRVGAANDEARRLFGATLAPGTPVREAGLPEPVAALLVGAAPVPEGSFPVVVGERVLVCVVRPVQRDGRPLGRVLSVRDRTDVEQLTRQLDAVRTLSTALRAQRHEFANRLHVVHGLLWHGHPDRATDYVGELLGSGPLGTLLDGLDAVADASLQAFLSAKAAHFRERAVALRIGPRTWLSAQVGDPVAVTTVVGNLLDNAADAAASRSGTDAAASRSGTDAAASRSGTDAAASSGGTGPEQWVEIELLGDGDTLFVTVTDSGDGVAPQLVDSLFAPGATTRVGDTGTGERGLGLALVRQVARALGGDVWLADPGGPPRESDGGTGAVFVARLPGVLGARAGAPRVAAAQEVPR